MPTEFVMLPPQTERTREWSARLAAALPELKVIAAENARRGGGRQGVAERCLARLIYCAMCAVSG